MFFKIKRPCILCAYAISCKLGLCQTCFEDLPRCSPVNLNTSMVQNIPGLRAVLAALWYQSEVQYWLRQFKFYGQTQAAKAFGALIAAQAIHFYASNKLKMPDVLVPIAMTPYAQAMRGYNQASLIANEVAEHLGIPVLHVLERVHQKKKAHRLKAKARLQILEQSFRVRHPFPRGSRVALIDDVITTGATLRVVAQLFPPQGLILDAWAVAYTPPPRPS